MEYWVSHVKKKGNYITQVKAFFNTVEGLKNPNLFNREEIVRSIDEKDSLWFMCILNEGISGKRIWEKGVRIHTVEVDGNKYIRTDGNRKESDNLGELPPINQEYKE
jgi:hypothetical protein